MSLAESLPFVPGARVNEILVAPGASGWDKNADISANIHDAIVALLIGLGGKRMTEKDRYPRPRPVVEAKPVAPTIADFDIGSFMRQFNT